MNRYLDFLLNLLAQFAGGPGPKENNLVRFGLAAVLWAVLLSVAWSRQRQQELPREKWLVWGFGLGLTRELFMFSHLAVQLMDLEHGESASFLAEPLEHALTLAALIVVAGAFLRYLLDDVSTSRRYLWVGLTATVVCSFSVSWWWSQHVITNPTSKFNHSLGEMFFALLSSALIAIAIFLMARKRGWLRNVVLVALTLFMLSSVLRIANFATNRVYTDIFCRVSNSFHIGAIPVLGYVYLREQAIEKRRAEEELESYHDHLEELVEERTRELETTQEELIRKERLAALGQLTTTVAHEIRNPLGTVRSCVFSIGDAIERDEMERVERALQLAERNIIRCDNIITELLDYTRDRPLQVEPATRIDGWLDALLDEQVIPEDIVCTRELASDAQVSIDCEHLRRAIVNVLDNAVDALQDKEATDNQLNVSTHIVSGDRPTADRLEIRFSDTGPGIPDDVLDRVFEPLFSTKSFGVGLGLSIVKSILEQHSGGVEIESKVGLGTTVVLWLPV